MKCPFILAGGKYASGKFVPFNSANGSPANEFPTEYPATSPGEECEFA